MEVRVEVRVEEKGMLVPRWLLAPEGKGAFYYTVTVCVSWMLCGRDQHPIEKGYSPPPLRRAIQRP